MINPVSNTTAGNKVINHFIRSWHLVIIIICLITLFTGDLAHDYKKPEFNGFIIHGWMGLVFGVFLCLYLGYGFAGPRGSRFSTWFPFTGNQPAQIKKDFTTLMGFQLPEHKSRQGLAGLIQFLGILVFSWAALTGALLFLFIEPGSKVRGILHAVKEGHEVGVMLIPLYLALHIGAVLAHSLSGRPVWRDIFFRKGNSVAETAPIEQK
ncbi:MAG: cytochrome b/b6 domain-containing protein [Desulfobulbaceae bacterium]|nr:cytochrome b/b6 domain-containing protein [Desulfobulbaceae bacterium]